MSRIAANARSLVQALQRSDAGRATPPYQVVLNQVGHGYLGWLGAVAGALVVSPWAAAALTLALAGAKEVRDMTLGRRHASLRERALNSLGDWGAYAFGAAPAVYVALRLPSEALTGLAVLSVAPGLWAVGVALLQGAPEGEE